MTRIFLSVILIIILLWLTSVYQTNIDSKNLLYGFYTGDDTFMQEAGLSNIILYLDNKTGHIFLQKSSGDILLNDTFNWHISNNFSKNMNSDLNKKRIYKITFKDLDNTDLFPSNQTLEFYPLVGKIILQKNNTVFAVLYKDSVASEVKNILSKESK